MEILKELEVLLNFSNIYYKKGVPSIMSVIDVEINTIMNNCKLISKDKVKILQQKITSDIGWLLLSFAENMASYSLRTSKQELFTNGLLALSLIFDTIDWREIILIMTLFYDVHKRIGLSFEGNTYFESRYNLFLEEFLNREESNKTIESMGYILMEDENANLTYQRIW